MYKNGTNVLASHKQFPDNFLLLKAIRGTIPLDVISVTISEAQINPGWAI